MSDRRAHVKLSRRLFEKGGLWEEPRVFSKMEAWIDLIQWAAWKPHPYVRGEYREEMERGEFIASLRYLAKRWQWSKTAVSDYLKALQKKGRISRRRDGHWGTVYILVNYDFYQGRSRKSGQSSGQEGGQQNGQKRSSVVQKHSSDDEKKTWLTPYFDPWAAKIGKPPIKRMAKEIAPVRDELGDTEAVARWVRYLDENDAKFVSPERFAATHQRYAGPATEMRTDDFGRMVLHARQPDGSWIANGSNGKASA